MGYVVVVRNSKIVLERSFVHPHASDQGVDIRPDSIFQIASVTKPLTATLVMKNVEMGNLSLQTPVADYIPEFGKNGKEIVTPRHLLTHSSGLSDKISGPKPTSFNELLERIYEKPLVFVPGTNYSYSTLAFEVLIELIQKTSGLNLEKLSRKLLFGPLGMNNSYFNTPGAPQNRVIPLFDRSMKVNNKPYDTGLERNYHFKFNVGGGNGLSTPIDIAILCQMMLNGGNYNGLKILSPVTVSRMVENQFEWWDSPNIQAGPNKPDFVSQGLGWMVRNKAHYRGSDIMSNRAFFHGGAYGMRAIVDPEYDLITIFLTSAYHEKTAGNKSKSTFSWLSHHHQIQQIFGNMVSGAIIK